MVTSIVTRAGPALQLSRSTHASTRATVYNFEVEDSHTYFVGKNALWVHNTCGFPANGQNHPFSLQDVTRTDKPFGPDFDRIIPDPDGYKTWLIERKDFIEVKSNPTAEAQKAISQLEGYIENLQYGTNLPPILQDGINKLRRGQLRLGIEVVMPPGTTPQQYAEFLSTYSDELEEFRSLLIKNGEVPEQLDFGLVISIASGTP